MTEPDVTLTDYALALECFAFSVILAKRHGLRAVSGWFIVFFAAIGMAAAAGGTVHGFFQMPGPAHDLLWLVSLIAVGVMALSGWMIGISLLELPRRGALAAKTAAGLQFGAYILYLALVSRKFLAAILIYLPAAVFLLGVFIYRYCRTRAARILPGIAAMLMTFGASFVQQAQIALHPVYFNHNALYHLIQFVALFLLFLTARHFIETTDRRPHAQPP